MIMLTDVHTHHPAAGALCSGSPKQVREWIHSGAPGQFSVGIHPWCSDAADVDAGLAEIELLASNRKVLAIGEAGIDKLRGASLAAQCALLRAQIAIAEKHGKPLVLHCVRGVDEILAMRRRYHALRPWIWHGFRGKPALARQILDFDSGFYLSLGERFNAEAVRLIPHGRMLLETDESRLSVDEIGRMVDEARGDSPGSALSACRQNLELIFGNGASFQGRCI